MGEKILIEYQEWGDSVQTGIVGICAETELSRPRTGFSGGKGSKEPDQILVKSLSPGIRNGE